MNLLFYANGRNGAGERLRELIEAQIPKRRIKIYRTLKGLSHRLRRPRYDVAITVLFAGSRKELQDLFSIRALLWNLRIILILPDGEADTIAKGHKLFPRFLSYADGNFMDVAAVLKKMLKRVSSKRDDRF